MYGPYWQPPPGMYGGNQGNQGNRDYERYLRKELKDLRKKEGLSKSGGPKSIWAKREIVALAIFTAPLLAPAYLGLLKLSLMLIRKIIDAP
jgi:hypothetical protein